MPGIVEGGCYGNGRGLIIAEKLARLRRKAAGLLRKKGK
jgi:hypothetical protein